MGFKASKADLDVWMKSSKDDNHYEYIAAYVDDLAICMKYPKAFCDTLKENTNSNCKELDQSVTMLDVDIPEMKLEPLLQIQENMLKNSLSHMKKCLVANQRRPNQNTTNGRGPSRK